jgi:hypothetical protein
LVTIRRPDASVPSVSSTVSTTAQSSAGSGGATSIEPCSQASAW